MEIHQTHARYPWHRSILGVVGVITISFCLVFTFVFTQRYYQSTKQQLEQKNALAAEKTISTENTGTPIEVSSGGVVVTNQLLVKVSADAEASLQDSPKGKPLETGQGSLNKKLKEEKAVSFEKVAKKNSKSLPSHDLFRWYLVTLDGPQEQIDIVYNRDSKKLSAPPSNEKDKNIPRSDQAVTRLEATRQRLLTDPVVEAVEPNAVVTTQIVPNDTYFASTGAWGQTYRDMWGLDKIGATAAWDQTTGSANVVVAVIDTGVDRNHPDMASNMWTNTNELPGNNIDDDNNGYIDDYYGWDYVNNDNDPMDDHGHGTHCSGTVGATGNNNLGVIGVNWTTKIMAVKFLNNVGSGTTFGGIQALQYAADNGAKVSSNSWGGGGFIQAMDDAISYEHERGMVVIAAAGNSNADALFFSPANSDHVIAVAASDWNDTKASFSNWGEKIDVAAPGVNILSVRAKTNPMCTPERTIGTGEYSYCLVSGTSMATPHVAGLAALLLAKNPLLSNEEVRQIIRFSADDVGTVGKDISFGYGRIQVATTISNSDTSPLTPVITGPKSRDVVGGSISITGSVAGSNFASYKLERGFGQTPTSWFTITESSSQVINGVLATFDTTKVSDSKLILRLTATDTNGKKYLSQVYEVQTENYDAEISGPTMIIPQGIVNFIGTAQTKNGLPFQRYQLRWANKKTPFSWSTAGLSLTNGGLQSVSQGSLGSWDTSTLVDGDIYDLKLTVYSDSAFVETTIPVMIDRDLQAGWPVPLTSAYTFGSYYFITPGIADVDGDGNKEIVILEPAGKISVYRKNGTLLPGFPFMADPGYLYTKPVNLADLNNDGKSEIIASAVNTANQAKIYIISGTGTTMSGWPTPSYFSYEDNDITPSVGDVNSDGQKELVFADSNGILHVVNLSGGEINGFPKLALPANHYGGPVSLIDVNRDGRTEILTWSTIYQTTINKVFVFDSNGNNFAAGWPFQAPSPPGTTYPVYIESPLSAGDIDGDGAFEIFGLGQVMVPDQPSPDAILYGWRANGSVMTGWPIREGRIYPYADGQPILSSPSVVDIDTDGRDEVLVASNGIKVYGQLGLEYQADDSGITSPAIFDIDNDGRMEIVSIYNYKLKIIDDDNSVLWQRTLPYNYDPYNIHKFLSPAVLADLDNDGKIELVLAHTLAREAANEIRTNAYVWELPFAGGVIQKDWPLFAHDPQRSGRTALTSAGSPTPIPPTPTSPVTTSPTPTRTPTPPVPTPTSSIPTLTPTPTGVVPTPTRTPTPTPALVLTSHIGDLDGGRVGIPVGKNWKAKVTARVDTQFHVPLSGVTVRGTWVGATGSDSCITTSTGTCTLTTNNTKNLSVTFTITSLSHPTYPYKATDNHDYEGDSNGTVIVVYK